MKFCDSNKLRPLPLSQSVLCLFLSYLADQSLQHRTIKTYMSGLRFYQIRAGYGDPFATVMLGLDYVLKSIKRVQAMSGSGARVCLPITPAILSKLKSVWLESASNPDTKLIWAACCLCFFAFLRVGEMTTPDAHSYDPGAHLCYADIALDDARKPSFMRVYIKQSKMDPFRRGIDLFVGRTGSDLCPVAALLDYL